LVIDPTSTYGNGNRPWLAVDWHISIDGGTVDSDLTDYFNINFKDTSVVLVVPKELLFANTIYAISLSVTNFLGKQSAVSISVAIGSKGTPTVNIDGPQTRTIFRSQRLDLTGSLILPSCVTNSSSVSYRWKIYQMYNYKPSIVSIAFNPSSFVLAPFTLDASLTYTIVLTGSYLDSVVYQYSFAQTTLTVGEAGVVAQIRGGNTRVVQLPFEVDASSSYDIDYPTETDLEYLWQCNVASGPSFGAPCGLNSTFYTQPSFLVSNALVKGTSYNFTVLVQKKGSLMSSTAYVIITIALGPAPNVALSSTEQIYAANARVVFSGLVLGSAPTFMRLTCDKVNDTALSYMSVTSLALNSTINQTRVMYALKPFSLYPGSGKIYCLFKIRI
jgi:hypothetical protein